MRNVEFINAGAGSGKTYTLTHKLADLLSLQPIQYNPSEIILTTFTELAAGEFKEKARQVLMERNMNEVASKLDTAAIGTVHSIAYRFIKKYWYILGRGVNDSVMTDEDKTFYINQSIASVATEEDINFFEQVRQEFNFSMSEGSRTVSDKDFWLGHLSKVISIMDEYEVENLQLSREYSKSQIDLFFNQNVTLDVQGLKIILAAYVQICTSGVRRDSVKKFIDSKYVHYSDFLGLSALAPTTNEKKAIPELDVMFEQVIRKCKDREFGDILKKYIDRIFDLATLWRVEFVQYKNKNHLIDYNDMEQLFLKLLTNETVANEIKATYKLVFVDEFQDSNPVQLKIFDKLSELVEKSIWVGDPKQAIYGFRGSDAQLIQAISSVFYEGDKERNLCAGAPLNTSYRSRPELVDLTNSVFTRAFPNIPKKNVVLNAHRNDKEEFGKDAPTGLHHWHMVSAQPHANNTEHYQILAQQVLKFLQSGTPVIDKNTKQVRSAQPQDIAILTRTNTQCQSIANELRACGVEVAASVAEDNIGETAEYCLLVAILSYLLDRRNDLAKAEILYLLNGNDYSVEKIIQSRIQYLNNPEEHFTFPKWESEHPFITKLDNLVEKKALPIPDLLELLYVQLDLKSIVSKWGNAANRRKTLHFILRQSKVYDDRCFQMGIGSSLNNFVLYIRNLGSTKEKHEAQPGAVNVLTYHSSKGLEWNVVILESMDNNELEEKNFIRKSYFGVNDVLRENPTRENLFPERFIQLLPWFLGARRNVSDEQAQIVNESGVFQNQSAKTSEEIKRLMYVGATRARDYLITTSYERNSLHWLKAICCELPDFTDHKDPTINLWTTNNVSAFTVCSFEENVHTEQGAWNEKKLVRPHQTPIFQPRYVNPSKMVAQVESTSTLLKEFKHRITISGNKNSIGDSLTDDKLGTCLHNIFCIYQPGSPQNLNKVNEILSNHLMRSVFTNPESIITSMDNLYHFLEEHYGPAIRVYKEMPIQMKNDQGQIIRGSCDLIWETAQGAVIVDYKSYQGGLDKILSTTDEHRAAKYATQLNAYSDVLILANKIVLETLIYYAISGNLVLSKINS